MSFDSVFRDYGFNKLEEPFTEEFHFFKNLCELIGVDISPFTQEDFKTAQIEYKKYVFFKRALDDIITIRRLWSKKELKELCRYNLNNPVLERLMISETREDKEIKEILSLESFEILKIEKEYINFYEKKKYFLNSLLCYLSDNSNQQKFNFLCKIGSFEVAQWLHSLGDVDIYNLDEYAFKMACKNGHLEVAQWLWSLGGFHKDGIETEHQPIKDWLATLD